MVEMENKYINTVDTAQTHTAMPRARHIMDFGLLGCFDDPSLVLYSLLAPPVMFGCTMQHIKNFPCGSDEASEIDTDSDGNVAMSHLRMDGDPKRFITACMLYSATCCFAEAWGRMKIAEDLAVHWDGVAPATVKEQLAKMKAAQGEEEEEDGTTCKEKSTTYLGHLWSALFCCPCALSQEARTVIQAHSPREGEEAVELDADAKTI